MNGDTITLTRAEAAIIGGLLRVGYENSAFSATSVANRASRLGLSILQFTALREKLGRMDAWAEEDGVL